MVEIASGFTLAIVHIKELVKCFIYIKNIMRIFRKDIYSMFAFLFNCHDRFLCAGKESGQKADCEPKPERFCLEAKSHKRQNV